MADIKKLPHKFGEVNSSFTEFQFESSLTQDLTVYRKILFILL